MSTPPRRLRTNRQNSESAISQRSQPPPTQPSRKFKDCRYCDKEHPLRKCFRFRRLAVRARCQVVRRLRYCFNCLAHSHVLKSCRSRERCKICLEEHHTLLHLGSTTKDHVKHQSQSNIKIKRKRTTRPHLSTSNNFQHNQQYAKPSNNAPTIVINLTSK